MPGPAPGMRVLRLPPRRQDHNRIILRHSSEAHKVAINLNLNQLGRGTTQ